MLICYAPMHYRLATMMRANSRPKNKQDFLEAYQKVDVLVGLTYPTNAFELGAKASEPLTMYLSDVCTIPLNLGGEAGIIIQWGLDQKGLTIGLQIMSDPQAFC